MALASALSKDKKTEAPSVGVRTVLALDGGPDAEIVGFENLSDAGEHVALVFPPKEAGTVPLVRIHSECLTGDVFGSAQCDCGRQLAEAKARIGAEGGVLLYLRQEGRGIGLYNKLLAYRAQREHGLDTFAANRHIGFSDDLRSFRVAAEMLLALGFEKIRLLTNNPDKTRDLREHGIIVDDVIPTGRFETPENSLYLQSKRERGHSV